MYSYISNPSRLSVRHSFFNVLGSFDYSGRTLHVLQGKAEAYQANEYWSPYFGQIVDDLMPAVLPGDVNADGEVNIADVNTVINMVLGGTFDTVGDVNSDGEINIADINALIDIILGN